MPRRARLLFDARTVSIVMKESFSPERQTRRANMSEQDKTGGNEPSKEITRRTTLTLAAAVATFGAAMGMRAPTAWAQGKMEGKEEGKADGKMEGKGEGKHEHRHEHKHRHEGKHDHRHEHRHEGKGAGKMEGKGEGKM
jgi:hypothetical protein